MKIRYIGDARAMNYVLGIVEPGQVYEIKKEEALKLIGGLFEEVKVKKVKKDGD